MRRIVQLVLVLALVGGAVSLRADEVIDRIVATVNNAPILQSDVDLAMRYEALLEGRRLETLSAKDEQATLQRLIDQELLRQQMGKDFAAPKQAEVAARVREVRTQVGGDWNQLLRSYGLDESEVTERIARQLQITRFIDQRLRPSIHVDQASVQAYFNDKLLPELRKSGVQSDPTLREVRPQIVEILTQEQLDDELTEWLRNLRQQSRVHTAPEFALPSSRDVRDRSPEKGRVESGG